MFRLLIFILLPVFLFADSVLVSIAPHKYFVDKIAGRTVDVVLMVPPGVSAHTFEPTPKQVVAASKADIWFQMGDVFEPKASAALKYVNPQMKIVDLREGVDLIYEAGCEHCRKLNCCDPHIWLSPKEAKVQARTIAAALIERYPQNKEVYQKNLENFLNELDQLNRDLVKIFREMPNKTIMVSHPAYGYLARDYGFEQLSLEYEGKDPTPQQLTSVIEEARRKHIKAIFVQEQLNAKGSKLVAQLLGAKVVYQDPYQEDYLKNIREIVHAFADQDKP